MNHAHPLRRSPGPPGSIARERPPAPARAAAQPAEPGARARVASADALSGLLRTAVAQRADGGLLQRYRIFKPAANAAVAPPPRRYRVISGHHEFHAQRVTVTAANREISGARWKARPDLRVSDDGHMAVEHTNLTGRQPKVFYASSHVWAASNAKLAAIGSRYELYADRANAIEVTLPDGTTRQLDRVLPRVAAAHAGVGALNANQRGMTMHVDQDCIMVAEAILNTKGARAPNMPFKPAHKTIGEFQAANAVLEWAAINRIAPGVEMGFAKKAYEDPTANFTTVATAFAHLKQHHPKRARRAAQALGIDRYADPDVGEAYESYRVSTVPQPQQHHDAVLGFEVRDFWGQHIGAVVCKSGGDRITLENYARKYEIDQLASDAHYYFQMYGPSTKRGQTWHAAWTGPTAAGAPVGSPASGGHDALTGVVRRS
jgi:hypothetical protein